MVQTIAFDTTAPKYYILKQTLINKIENHEYRGNDLIPSERELVLKYQVSRITVRRALDELVKEGYLYRIQGKGTFVKAHEYSQNLVSITSCTQDVINLGMTPRRKVISSSIIDVDEERRSALELSRGDRVFRLERIYYANDIPINHTVTYLPYKLFIGIDGFDFSQESLYTVLEREYGVCPCTATRSIEAVLAKGKVAEALEVKPGVPILLFGCITYGIVRNQKIPIENFTCYYRSDNFKFFINQVAG